MQLLGRFAAQTDPATDDVAFAGAIFEWLADPQHLCADRDRLFAMGFSNGGAMTFRLQVIRGARENMSARVLIRPPRATSSPTR